MTPAEAGKYVPKRGCLKGSGAVLRMTKGDWFRACETFRGLDIKMSAHTSGN